MSVIAVMGVASILVLVGLGLVVALGRVVYKDAKAHGMSAGMWTAIVVLLPNLIGLIIYLVVRSNEEKKYICKQCGIRVEKDYNICPNCRNVLTRSCHACKKGISEDVAYCPYCGEKTDETEKVIEGREQATKSNILKPLCKIGIVFFVLMCLGFCSMFLLNVAYFEETKDISIMELETNMGNTKTAKFKYKQGNDKMSVYKQEGEWVEVVPYTDLTEGEVILQLINPSGEMIFEQVYTPDTQTHDPIGYSAQEEGKYVLKMQVNKASGMYTISMY